MASVTDLDERRILTAYIYSGRRRAELLRLEWADVDMERDEYHVRKSKASLSKWYPMHPMFRAVLEAIVRGEGRIFARWQHPDSITHLAATEPRTGSKSNHGSNHKSHADYTTTCRTAGALPAAPPMTCAALKLPLGNAIVTIWPTA